MLTVSGDVFKVDFGLVWADGLEPGRYPPGFDQRLEELLDERAGVLENSLDVVRLAARDMLRNGRYKPTGRAKPASEYLLRAAAEGSFPRIAPAVDICNWISLRYLVPASIWDRDLAPGPYAARLGREEEHYVFNAAGQKIDLQDLVLLADAESDRAMVNPVKDSQATKTHADSTRVAAVVYTPRNARLDLSSILDRFAELLGGCGTSVETGVLKPQSVEMPEGHRPE